MGKGGTVHGADTVARTMRVLADDVRQLGESVGPDAAAVVVRTAQGFAPRRTGRLRSSIQPTTVTAAVTTVTAGVGITYAGVQEYGSRRRHIEPKLYMKRTADTQEKTIAGLYETAADNAAAKVKGV